MKNIISFIISFLVATSCFAQTQTVNGNKNNTGIHTFQQPIVQKSLPESTTNTNAITIDAQGNTSTTPIVKFSPISAVGTSNLFSKATELNAGVGVTTGVYYSNFFGLSAGNNATDANNSNFFGSNAGYGAISAHDSMFFGAYTGREALYANDANFLGSYAGYGASSANNSNFFGRRAGYMALGANNSNFFGYSTGYGASSAGYSNLFGFQVGYNPGGAGIGANNIIIGTNISLPAATANSINIGGVLFGTGTYSTLTGNPSTTPNNDGKIGIGIVNPTEKLDVAGKIKTLDGVTSAVDHSSTLGPLDYPQTIYVDAVSDSLSVQIANIQSQINPNTYVITDAGYSQVGQVITVNSGWQWKINNIDYTNPSPIAINIPLATVGYSRIDLIVLNASNAVVRVAGVETIGAPVSPAVPLNTIQILFTTTDSETVGTPVIPRPRNQVSQFIRNGETTYSPSEDVVYDNITLKIDKNAPITGATNTKITYDSKGLVTSGASLSASDIPTIAQSQVTSLVSDLALKANLDSPNLTGTPTAPTATAGTNTTQIATTAFVLANAGALPAHLEYNNTDKTIWNNGNGNVSSNTSFGSSALGSNTTGDNNTANGYQALLSNTTGYQNTANGVSALRLNTTGYQNTANGYQALRLNTTGINNTANGYQALSANTTGSANTANGNGALYSNTTGGNNTANGTNALYFNTSGSSNTINGSGALLFNTTGSNNIANGVGAGYFISAGTGLTIANNSVFLGYDTRALTNNETNQIVIGYTAIGNGSNTVTLGNDAIVKTVLKGLVTAPLTTNALITADATGKALITKEYADANYSGGGGGGSTNLTTTQSPTTVTVNSDTGTDATIVLANGTNAGVSTNDYTTTEKSKLAGIATGATANSSDATLLDRANHTGTQTASTISDFNTSVDSRIAISSPDLSFLNVAYASTISRAYDNLRPNLEIDLTGNLDFTLTGTSGGDSGLLNLYFSGTETATLQGVTDLVVTGAGEMIPVYFVHDSDGIKWYRDETGGATVDTSLFALKNGTILYHTIPFTGITSTITTLGTDVTISAGQFPNDRSLGNKITINGESRVITAWLDWNHVTVDSAFSTNYTNEPKVNWDMYSKAVEIDNTATIYFYSRIGFVISKNDGTNSKLIVEEINSPQNTYLLGQDGLKFRADRAIRHSNGTSVGDTADIGLRRNSAGIYEVYDGNNPDGLEANRRDLLVRNLTANTIKIGNSTSTASASNEGSFRYTKTANSSNVEMVMQTGATTYEWVNILSNNW